MICVCFVDGCRKLTSNGDLSGTIPTEVGRLTALTYMCVVALAVCLAVIPLSYGLQKKVVLLY